MVIHYDTDALKTDLTPVLKSMQTGVGIAITHAETNDEPYPFNANDCEVSLSFCTPDEIKALNRDYRNKDAETDVLSFPGFPGSPALGDIVICTDVAKRQAEEYGHSYERELSFLAVHGLLHLLGYDHETPEDETNMCDMQDKIMQAMGIPR